MTNYKPRTKAKLVELLAYWYPKEKNKFKRMKFDTLYAIYMSKQAFNGKIVS